MLVIVLSIGGNGQSFWS